MAKIGRFLPGLDDEQIAALTSFEVTEPHGRITNIAELVAGWVAHVDRLISETDRSLRDSGTWTEHDYVAALHLRDRLALGLQRAPGNLASLARDSVAAVDGRFESWTRVDEANLLTRAVPRNEIGRGWWWHRVPGQGPVLESLLQLRDSG